MKMNWWKWIDENGLMKMNWWKWIDEKYNEYDITSEYVVVTIADTVTSVIWAFRGALSLSEKK